MYLQELFSFFAEIPPPLGFWPLNSKHGFKDDKEIFTTTATEVTLTKGPCDAPDAAFQFSKLKKSHLRVAKHTKLNSPGSFSITVMLKPNPGQIPIVRFALPNNNQGTQMFIVGYRSSLYLGLRTSRSYKSVNSYIAVPHYLWSFIGVSYDASTGKLIFVVNERNKTITVYKNLISYTPSDLLFGARITNREYFDGAMSSLRFFDVALTAEEMRSFRIKCPPRGRNVLHEFNF
jgi:hypothetical protein